MKNFKIGVFCPSNPLAKEPKDSDYAFLKTRGIEIYEHPQVRVRGNYMAGSIVQRIDAIHSMLQDPSIDMLMAFWGGANTNQLLPYLDYDLIAANSKPIVGFSDVTALLLAVYKMSGVRTYMGAGGITFKKPEPFEYSYDYLKKLIIDREPVVTIVDSPEYADDQYFLREDNDHRIMQENKGRQVFRHGKAEGTVIAANLQTLMVLAGTPYFPDLTGTILFLEEAEDEDPSMIHRFFTHLSQVVDLSTLAGICIGRFPSQCGFEEGNTEELIYEDVFRDLDIPIVYNLDFGHTDPLFTIPIGGKVKIDTHEGLLQFIQD